MPRNWHFGIFQHFWNILARSNLSISQQSKREQISNDLQYSNVVQVKSCCTTIEDMSPGISRRCNCGVKNKHLESIHHVSTNNSSCKSDLRASHNSPELSGEVPQCSTLGQIILSCMTQGYVRYVPCRSSGTQMCVSWMDSKETQQFMETQFGYLPNPNDRCTKTKVQ